MHLLEDRTVASDVSAGVDADALIREARRLRRRRWSIGCAVVLAVAAAGTGYSLASHRTHSAGPVGRTSRTQSKQPRPSTLPTGPTVTLDLAGSLAVGPNGALYVAAPDQHRILVRLPNGTFKVVAGTGTAGYSGNGKKAIDAELSGPSNLTFDAKGNLYFVDSERVRVITTGGVIKTVAGDGSRPWPRGSSPVPTVANGTPAVKASFRSSPSIAFGSSGVLYIATSTQLLRMTHGGRLDTVPTHRVSFPKVHFMPTSLDGLATLAVANDGSLYVSGFNGWAIWRVAPGGAATYIGYDRGSGGSYPDLVRGPRGSVYAENGGAIVRITPKGFVTVWRLAKVDGQYFWATNFAFGRQGTLYADELPGNVGFEARQELVSLHGDRADVLWTEPGVAASRHSR